MQKNKILSAVLLCLGGSMAFAQVPPSVAAASAPSSAASGSMGAGMRRNSIETVDMLLQIENEKAVAQAKKDAQALLAPVPSAVPAFAPGDVMAGLPKMIAPPPAPITLYVESISGIGYELKANLSYGGKRYEGVGQGSKVGPCEITSIAARRVTLSPATKKVRATQCPSASWTGQPNPAEMMLGNGMGVGTSGLPGMPMPMPLPGSSTLAGSARSVQQPVNSFPRQ